ncbi:hypothetical protein [Cryobacterium aureum]|uniref:hypothetical protein n=1 Tax=Cryobacterium aureum TaxID=995037 RepID=UPI00101AD62C|nr:hypothetical protein [Cryobacterium aureum]
MPELTMLLPAGTTAAQTRALIAPEASVSTDSASDAPTYFVVDVLVHVLRFEVTSVRVTPGPWIGYWTGLSALLFATVSIMLWSGFQRRRRIMVTVFEREQSVQGSP